VNRKNPHAGRINVLRMEPPVDAAMGFNVGLVLATHHVPIRRVEIVREAHPFDFNARYLGAQPTLKRFTVSRNTVVDFFDPAVRGYSGSTVAIVMAKLRSKRLLAGQNTSCASATGRRRRWASICAKYSGW
jgi:hypothetical protein